MLAYATKADIVLDYPEVLDVVLDYWQDDVDEAQDAVDKAQAAYDKAVAEGAQQSEIDALLAALNAAKLALADAKTAAQTNADSTIQSHLERAKGLIDECIPNADQEWVKVPRVLRDLSVDMAVYWCALPADWRTDEMETRWETAQKRLKAYCDGKLHLRGGELPPEAERVQDSRGFAIGVWKRG